MGNLDGRSVPSSDNDFSLHSLASVNIKSGKETDLRDLLFVPLRKWLILTIVVISTSVVGLYALSAPPIYESSAMLELTENDPVYLGSDREAILRSYGSYDDQNTQVQLLTNPDLVRRVVYRPRLDRNPAFFGAEAKQNPFSSLRLMLLRKKPDPSSKNSPMPDLSPDLQPTELTPVEISEYRWGTFGTVYLLSLPSKTKPRSLNCFRVFT
jgi:hypothetical protein